MATVVYGSVCGVKSVSLSVMRLYPPSIKTHSLSLSYHGQWVLMNAKLQISTHLQSTKFKKQCSRIPQTPKYLINLAITRDNLQLISSLPSITAHVFA